MEILLLIVAVPIAVWILDRLFYRGELAEAVVEAVTAARDARKKSRRNRGIPAGN